MEESPGLRKASHIGLWILVILIGGWLIWTATHATTENTKNLPGSIDNHKEVNYYPLSFGLMGCDRLLGVDGRPIRKNDKDNIVGDSIKH